MDHRQIGWHLADDRRKYRYWDGEQIRFAARAKEIDRFVAAGHIVDGVDFMAPRFGGPPASVVAKRRLAVAVVLVVGAIAALLVAQPWAGQPERPLSEGAQALAGLLSSRGVGYTRVSDDGTAVVVIDTALPQTQEGREAAANICGPLIIASESGRLNGVLIARIRGEEGRELASCPLDY